MDYKEIVAAFLELLKDFLRLILGEEKFDEVSGEVNDILGIE